LIIEGMQAAKRLVRSRLSISIFARNFGAQRRQEPPCKSSDRIVKNVDVLVGNEEDLQKDSASRDLKLPRLQT